GSLEPRIITEEFLVKLKENEKVCPHFHLSLQSGSATVLKRMNRHYSPDEYYEKCCLIRRFYPDAAITTDIIVGFPQETKEEFEETMAFAKKVDFFEMHVFKYSARTGTKAAAMSGQIIEAEKGIRSNRLIELGDEMSKKFREKFVGTCTSVLFEEKAVLSDGKEYWVGHTAEYVKVAVLAENVREDITGKLLLTELMDLSGEVVVGTLKIA
ncbi:MAG: radical SAM protein, partial [Lachnospiraceae bacterium]|nr:radical SAM protein [Lachnospiraceae bacterium]